MRHYHPLEVGAVSRAAEDAVRITLQVPEDLRGQFAFRPGQHLPLRARIDGRNVMRTYSICSPPGRWPLELGIRVQAGGAFSRYAEGLAAGDVIEVMPPTGAFSPHALDTPGLHRVAFAAGNGITPVLSILAAALEVPRTRCTLFYANRTLASTMFVEELFALKNRFPARLALHFLFSREAQAEAIYEGRLDAARVEALWDAFCRRGPPVDEVFVCGPGDLAEVVRGVLRRITALDEASIHSERFAAARRPARTGPDVAVPAQTDAAADDAVEVELLMDGRRRRFRMPGAGMTVLEGAERAGIGLPYSCRGGVCATCRTHLRAGRVRLAANYGLEPWELEAGYVLACQAHPRSDRLVLDYDRT